MDEAGLRLVGSEDAAASEVAALLAAIKENTDATKRLVDELVRDRAERRQAKSAGTKRSATIRARNAAVTPRTISPEAHAAAERVVSRLGRR